MFLENFKIVTPSIVSLVETVDIKILEEYYNEISVITDLSDKNYKKDISSTYIWLIKSTFFYEYFIDKYKVNKKNWLNFILEINKLVWDLDKENINSIKSKIEVISNNYFSSVIDSSNTFDKSFVEKLEIEIKEGTTDLELVDTLFNQITYKIMEDNINTKALILQIIIDGISSWDKKEDIIFRISNLSEVYE